jgi:TRAP-type C4-dicarboxylate transport system permease small subunit
MGEDLKPLQGERKMEEKKRRPLFDVVIDSMAFLSGALLLIVAVVVAVSVTLRYLHLKSPIWVLQYTEYALLWMTFLGAAWLLKHNGHIRIDSLLQRIRSRIRRRLEIYNNILGCGVSLIVTLFGGIHTIYLFQKGILEVKATNVPKYIIFCIIPLGGLALTLQFARQVVAGMRSKAEKLKP